VRKLVIAGVVAASVVITSAVALSCGDKLPSLSAIARYRQVNAGAHPASILAYTPENSHLAEVVRTIEHQNTVGHKLHTFTDSNQLDQELKTGKYDLLLAEATAVDGLELRLSLAPYKPTVLPVAYNATRSQANEIEKKFHCLLKAPASAGHYIEAIDQAMELKKKSR